MLCQQLCLEPLFFIQEPGSNWQHTGELQTAMDFIASPKGRAQAEEKFFTWLNNLVVLIIYK